MSPDGHWSYCCTRCGRVWPLSSLRWSCECGGLLDLAGPPGELPGNLTPLGTPSPAVEVRPGLWVKSEMGHETGTFKARGASVMLSLAASLGVVRVVVDSSGNAGRAAAWFGSRMGMTVSVFVPAGTAPDVVASISEMGASVIAVGDRQGASVAAREQVETKGEWYASHVYQPSFHHGVKTLAFELAAVAPKVVVVPAGNGTLVMGLWLGFRELLALGRVELMPRLAAVQSAECAPLAGLAPVGPTAATGIAISHPPRLAQVRAAVAASGGRFLLADETDLEPARDDLARLGFAGVSLTSATVWAALKRGAGVPELGAGPVVVVLSGAELGTASPSI